MDVSLSDEHAFEFELSLKGNKELSNLSGLTLRLSHIKDEKEAGFGPGLSHPLAGRPTAYETLGEDGLFLKDHPVTLNMLPQFQGQHLPGHVGHRRHMLPGVVVAECDGQL